MRGWVEVRQPNTHGSLAVLTADNRTYFGQGEAVPFQIIARGKGTDEPMSITLRLIAGSETIAEDKVTMKDGRAGLVLAKSLTASLRAGRYRLTATSPGLTSVPQTLVIGRGMRPAPFSFIQYGDYGPTYPTADLWDAPDRTTAHIERTAKLSFNLMVDRLGVQRGALDMGQSRSGRSGAAPQTPPVRSARADRPRKCRRRRRSCRRRRDTVRSVSSRWQS